MASGSVLASMLLLEEMSHRVVNEYTQAICALAVAVAGSSDEKTRAALGEASRRLRAHADVHRALQGPLRTEPADLGEWIERLCSSMSQSRLEPRGLRLTFLREDVPLCSQRCWRATLIVSELITNCARHAFASRGGGIVVSVGQSGGRAICSVADDGAASPFGRGQGRGGAVVDALATELGGRLERSFSPQGSTVRLEFPLMLPTLH